MAKTIENQYEPDYVSPPGRTLLETIEVLGMSQARLAECTGRPKKTISEIVTGKAAITPETAIQFERVLGVPATFWNNHQRHYDEYLARRAEQISLEKQIEWLKEFPIHRMAQLGWIESVKDKVEQLQRLLNFLMKSVLNQVD